MSDARCAMVTEEVQSRMKVRNVYESAYVGHPVITKKLWVASDVSTRHAASEPPLPCGTEYEHVYVGRYRGPCRIIMLLLQDQSALNLSRTI